MEQKVIFKDGSAVSLVSCRGGHEQFRDAYRDALAFFIHPSEMGLDAADALFSPENCAEITLADGEKSFTHEGYTERVSISKGEYAISGAPMTLICVKMARKTENEKRMAELETATRIMLGMEE
ncbi:MAG: hypothetical protein J6W14_01520 [Clostridia bacterium]|nr:hypothetical protein [Clostridia bacterium]